MKGGNISSDLQEPHMKQAHHKYYLLHMAVILFEVVFQCIDEMVHSMHPLCVRGHSLTVAPASK